MMTKIPGDDREGRSGSKSDSWGPKLFWGTIAALLLFFYWLLIYSGGFIRAALQCITVSIRGRYG